MKMAKSAPVAHYTEADLEAFVERALPPEEQARAAIHVHHCPDCVSKVHAIQEAHRQWRKIFGRKLLAPATTNSKRSL